MVKQKALRGCAFGKVNILNGVSDKIGSATGVIANIPTKVLRSCFEATILKPALQRAAPIY